MNSGRFRTSFLVVIFTMARLADVNAADADLEKLKTELKAQIEAQTSAIKAAYEERIQQLEKRIQSLEGDNQRLKRGAPGPTKRQLPRRLRLSRGGSTSSRQALLRRRWRRRNVPALTPRRSKRSNERFMRARPKRATSTATTPAGRLT